MNRIYFIFCLLGVLILNPQNSCAQNWTPREAKFKAVFIWNLMRFTEFNNQRKIFKLCVAGPEYLIDFLDDLSDKKVKDKTLTIEKTTLDDSCDVLFVGNEYEQTEELLHSLRDKKVLTISERSDFLSEGGMIRLHERGGKQSFQVNISALRNAGLKISSKVLQLASSVDEYESE